MKSNKDNFNFSVIMAMYNVEYYLDESIRSLLNQTLSFEENIQLILIDDGSSDNSIKVAQKYQEKFPNNILIFSKKNGGVASARNLGLKYASGDYLNFMDSDDIISTDTFEKVNNFFSKYQSNDYDLVAIPVEFFESNSGEHFLNYKFEESELDFVDLNKNPEYYQCFTHSIFIKKDAINNLKFETKLIHFEDAVFVNKLLLKKMKFGIVKDAVYYYRKRSSQISITKCSKFKKQYYSDRFKYGYLELINTALKQFTNVPEFLQNVFIYDLQWLIRTDNFEDIINMIYTKNEIQEFYELFDEIINYIDINTINKHRVAPDYVKYFLISQKNNDFHVEAKPKNHKVFLKSNDITLNALHNHKIWIDIVELKNGFLNISGSYTSISDVKYIRIDAIKENKGKKTTYKSKYYDYYATYRRTRKLFGIPWKFFYNFDFKIPISDNETSKVYFKIIHDENDIVTSMKGRLKFRDHSNLSRENPYSVRGNKILLVRHNTFFIEDYTFIKRLKNEFKTISNIFKSRSEYNLMAIFYRLTYLLIYVYMKNKNIWVIMDRRNQSGDNAEHLYHYMSRQKDGIDKYFIIDKSSSDYKRLKKEYGNKIASYRSFKHRILYLYANKIISSHSNEYLNPFYEFYPKNYNGLITSETYFLQHGVPKYAMPNWLRKYDHNLSLIVAVSEMDYNSYKKFYNYDDEVIQILGYPRFDNLTNENMKRQILIMFSWRNNIKNKQNLLSSEFYHRLNNLINNEKLINHAKEKDYDIVFKLHPKLEEYIDLFEKNDFVKFDNVTKYHDLLCDSALMITDYSSVAFDFAYLKKPILYYQYGDDYHYDLETNTFDEERNGFGEILSDETTLVNKIIEYIDNDCDIEDKFKDNVDNFFKYHDKNNSKRCYEWIKEH